MDKNTISAAALFGAMAFVLALVEVPMHLGNPNLGTTPVSFSAVMFIPEISFIVGILKGAGASIASGKSYEFAAGIGDALMAVFTFYLLRYVKAEKALVLGQISRYLFTASLVALSVSLSMDGGIALFPEKWIDILPALTLSIIANSVVSVLLYRIIGERTRHWLEVRFGKSNVIRAPQIHNPS
ncbi:MAG TPA: hypothetical protein PLC12_02380 [Candidatus Methanofastidiosa archaeon]|nr:hypothetical protein [Candidatus Methanofastidiosa archaeon]